MSPCSTHIASRAFILLTVGEGLGEVHAVDPARRGPGDDVDDEAPDDGPPVVVRRLVVGIDQLSELPIGLLRPGQVFDPETVGSLVSLETRGGGRPDHTEEFLRHPVHVDGQGHAAVQHDRETDLADVADDRRRAIAGAAGPGLASALSVTDPPVEQSDPMWRGFKGPVKDDFGRATVAT